MSKYPYIPKQYYPAVMFACKMIRKEEAFNKAINTSSSYYDVDSEVLAQYVRERQAAGQKGKKRGKFKKYRFKGLAIHLWNERDMGEIEFDVITKALNLNNAYRQLPKKILGNELDPILEDLIYEKFEIKGEIIND